MAIGTTNNPNGRPKGTPNKLTTELRAALKNVLAGEIEKLPELLVGMPPGKRIELLIKLMAYAMPQVQPSHYTDGEPWDADLLGS